MLDLCIKNRRTKSYSEGWVGQRSKGTERQIDEALSGHQCMIVGRRKQATTNTTHNYNFWMEILCCAIAIKKPLYDSIVRRFVAGVFVVNLYHCEEVERFSRFLSID